jgi:hypothetical protein
MRPNCHYLSVFAADNLLSGNFLVAGYRPEVGSGASIDAHQLPAMHIIHADHSVLPAGSHF